MKRTLFFALALLIYGESAGQQPAMDSLMKKFRDYGRESLQEKIYVQLDQAFHLTGETLWFSIYVVDGSLHRPLNLSSIAYVELTDKSNHPVLQGKIDLADGRGDGSFFLPATLPTGQYVLRAYTRWMKNYKPEFFFHRAVTIVNPFVSADPGTPPAVESTRIHFFPEGGNLVAGLKSVVGFRILNTSGSGVAGEGVIIGPHRDTVVSFRSGKSGLGHFTFTPASGIQYQAVIKNEGRQAISHLLPEVHDAGYSMHLRDSGDFVRINIASKNIRESSVILFLHARQVTARTERKLLEDGSATFAIPVRDMPEGIAHFTLFDDGLNPLCERLYFTRPRNALEISARSEKREYAARQKVRLTVGTVHTGKPVAASLSATAFKIDSLSTLVPSGLHHYFWLTSDLTGTVANPDYYFGAPSDEVREATDDLMLTHGWRRFDWDDVLLREDRTRTAPEPHGHIISTKVTSTDGPAHGHLVYLSSPGMIPYTGAARSDRDGNAFFLIKNLHGPRRMYVRADAGPAVSAEIEIADPFAKEHAARNIPPLRVESMPHKALMARSISMQVQDIYYGERLRVMNTGTTSDSIPFFGVADDAYYLDDYTRFQVMEEVMREYVPGVFVRKRKDGFHFMLIDEVNGGLLPGNPLILLDGVPVADVNQVMALDPLKVKKLEVVRREYYLGHAVFSGIVSYTTYLGDADGRPSDGGGLVIDYEGLQSKRKFFDPHADMPRLNERMPDQRTLLHWDPHFTTDNAGKNTLEFYSSDVAGTYAVIVEGLTAGGASGTAVYTFTIKSQDHP